MGIDRPDEDDHPVVTHDSPAGARDALSAGRDSSSTVDETDSDAVRAAYSARLRVNVEAAYQAAWDEAAPVFRQRWESHESQYPPPERSRPTVDQDGSWRGGGRRELSPAQNAEVGRGCERIREVGERSVIPAMRDVEAEDASRHLVGFEHRFKGEDRLKEKVADQLRSTPGLTPTQALTLIPDAVRFTFQYPQGSYMAGVRADIDRFEAHGFIQVERRNTWTSEQYKGINSRWREPESGLIFEVQFHTSISFEAKQLTHKAYERIRAAAEESELSELKRFQRQVCDMIPLPQGVTEYEDYPPGRHDG